MRLCPAWLRQYRRAWLSGDLSAGFIVTVMLIPQSLAYAMLAGLPPEYGLYASILPPIAYACFGTSMALAVGPVAIIALMTANALAPLAEAGSTQYIQYAIYLAAISGAMLIIAGFLRLGALANLLSHPVVSGFITGAALLIILGQVKPLLELDFQGRGAVQTLLGIARHWQTANIATATLGVGGMVFLLLTRHYLRGMWGRLAPMVLVALATVVCAQLQLDMRYGVKVVGSIAAGLPDWHWVFPDRHALSQLWLPALLISLVGTVEGVSVARSLAQKKHPRIDANREFIGLGAANAGSAIFGGFPVAGGFSRSVVNLAAGAHTPLAGVIAAALMVLVLLGLTGWFYYLPQAVLAATIIVAVSALVDFSVLGALWRFDKADAVVFLVTLGGVLILGVEQGIVLGVVLSLVTLVYKTSYPHIATVGMVPGTEHFRSAKRFAVQTLEDLLALRVDESIYFGNAALIEQRIMETLQQHPHAKGLLLVMSAVNRIDATGLQTLERLWENLQTQGVDLLMAEVKGPVMNALQNTRFWRQLQTKVYLSAHEAFGHWQQKTTHS